MALAQHAPTGDMESLLRTLMGRDASLLPFQAETAGHLLEGRNVLLRAPTGAGKTWAVLLPFVWSFLQGRPIADRLIYALPLRTLATSLYASTGEAIARVKGAALGRIASTRPLKVTIQTGEQPDDPFFRDGNIIFCTIDQLLSSYLNMPLSLPARLGNINAGALVGALIVLDEVHLLDPWRALATSVDLARRLRDYSRFAFVTATLSSAAADLLSAAKLLNTERVDVRPGDIAKIPNLAQKKRLVKVVAVPLTPAAVLAHHRNRTLAICNTVGRAQELYRGLRDALGGGPRADTKLLLLHSRFMSRDRQERERALKPFLGPGSTAGNVIVVSTQAVEAGVDISADVLHTEACPANSLIQRFGRCARFAVEGRGEGECRVYGLPLGRTGQPSFRPYASLGIIEEDLGALSSGWSGKDLACEDEQRYVDAALSDREREVVAGLGSLKHSTLVLTAISGGKPGYLRELVRSIDAVNVIVRRLPEQLDATKFPLGVSMTRRSLSRLREFWTSAPPRPEGVGSGSEPAAVAGGDWVAKVPVPAGEDDDEAEHEAKLTWRVAAYDDVAVEPWVVALNPQFASYDAELGLVLGTPGYETPIQYYERPERRGYACRCEAWEDHVRRTRAFAHDVMGRHQIGRARCEEVLQLPSGVLEGLSAHAALLHDAGKLGVLWQNAARKAQQQVDAAHPLLTGGRHLAHTDRRPDADAGGSNGAPGVRIPPHSMEGAFLAALAVGAAGREGLLRCDTALAQVLVASAVAHHHAPRNSRARPFALCPGGARAILSVLKEDMPARFAETVFRPLTDTLAATFPDDLLEPVRDQTWLPAYWLLVRVLRLADQAASAAGGGKTLDDQEP